MAKPTDEVETNRKCKTTKNYLHFIKMESDYVYMESIR